jgi:hypothetical protein
MSVAVLWMAMPVVVGVAMYEGRRPRMVDPPERTAWRTESAELRERSGTHMTELLGLDELLDECEPMSAEFDECMNRVTMRRAAREREEDAINKERDRLGPQPPLEQQDRRDDSGKALPRVAAEVTNGTVLLSDGAPAARNETCESHILF